MTMTTTRFVVRWAITAIIFIQSIREHVVLGAPANPVGHHYEQPDGTSTPLLYLKGDEFYHWMADSKGYTVMQDHHGWYVYAKKENGILQPTAARVGTANPKKLGLTKQLQTDQHLKTNFPLNDNDIKDHRSLVNVPETALCNFNGSKNSPCRLKALVVLVRFTDHQGSKRILPEPEEIDILFNHNGPTNDDTAPTGSVSDVFLENSYDTFALESIVSPWVNVDRSEEQTVDNNNGLSNSAGPRQTWARAMYMLEQQGFDMGQFDKDGDKYFDCLVILHSGAAAEASGTDCESGKGYLDRVWSHSTTANFFTSREGIRTGRFYVASGVWGTCSKSNIASPRSKWAVARIAVIAHECAHFLGLPDLYDSGAAGVGNFDMQANMWGWYGTQYYPPLLSAWCKLKLNWINTVHVTASGTHQLHKACTSNTVLVITNGMPEGEYFLLENRYPCGFDSELKHRKNDPTRDRNGIAIWHIDESGLLGQSQVSYTTEGTPEDSDWPKRHYKVALVQGDGFWQLEKGGNQGDRYDLFKLDTSPSSNLNMKNSAYYIGPGGVKRNKASDLSHPNTNSYARGYEVETGIQIEVGEPGPIMTVTITIDQSDISNNGDWWGGDWSHSTEATPSPTARPTLRPTIRPTNRPTQGEGSNGKTELTCDNAKEDTVIFTGVGTHPESLHKVSCRFVNRNEDVLCGLDDLTPGKPQGWKIWQTCQVQCDKVTGCGGTTTTTTTPAPTLRPTSRPTEGVDESFPLTCDNAKTDTVMFTGIGDYPDDVHRVSCKFVNRREDVMCGLDDLTPGKPEGWKIWQTCQNQCEKVTGCGVTPTPPPTPGPPPFEPTCDNAKTDTIMFTGIGNYPNEVHKVSCKFVNRREDVMCELDDLTPGKPAGWKVWQTCQNQCEKITGCGL